MNSWSDASTVDESSFADSESVRAIRSMGHRIRSVWKRDAISREVCVEVGTRTFPAKWPHCGVYISELKRKQGRSNLLAPMQLILEMDGRSSLFAISYRKGEAACIFTDSTNSFTSFITAESPPCLQSLSA